MGIFDGCLLAADIDGTLVGDEGTVNPRCIEKIKYFVSEGGAFSIATGRSVGAISCVLKAIDCLSPSVVMNGAVIYDYKKEKTVHQLLLPDSDKAAVFEVMECFPNVGIEVHCGARAILLRRNSETDDHETYEDFTAEPMDFKNCSSFGWNKVLFTFTDTADIDCVKVLLAGKNLQSNLINTTAFVYDKQRYYLELIPKNVSKAEAVVRLCGLLGIKNGGLFTIGDYYNDVPMLRCADVCAVPENSPEDIKAVSDVVVSTAKDGAVADFIDYLSERGN